MSEHSSRPVVKKQPSFSIPRADEAMTCCCAGQRPTNSIGTDDGDKTWNIRYIFLLLVFSAVWWLLYQGISPFANWLVYKLLSLEASSQGGAALAFFLYDTAKILLLLVALIYGIGWLRASLRMERIREVLAGRGRALGYVFAALFGAVTPFCSCSSVPLFLGFTSAGIPVGIAMAFLITSPLINEIAIVLLWNLLGWKFAVIYVSTGMMAGILGGLLMDVVRAGRWLQPDILEGAHKTQGLQELKPGEKRRHLTLRQRHRFAWGEMCGILHRIWLWVVTGVAAGAVLHGFVPEDWFAAYFSAHDWWTVPAAVLMGIPLYSNVSAIVPVMESLLLKGLPLGTTLAFCMSSVAASIPEFIMLHRIMTFRLQALFIVYLWVVFTLAGWLFNSLQTYLL